MNNIKLSLPDFVKQYDFILSKPQAVYKEREFKSINDVLNVRNKIINSNDFFFSVVDGTTEIIRKNGDYFPLNKGLINSLKEQFKDHEFIVKNSIFELSINEDGIVYINDVFNVSNFNDSGIFQFQLSNIRFALLSKIFRETKSYDKINFNIPKILGPSVTIERYKNSIDSVDIFPFLSSYKISFIPFNYDSN